MKAWQKTIPTEGSLPQITVQDAAATLQPRPLPPKPSHTVLWHSTDPDHYQHAALPALPWKPLDTLYNTWLKSNMASRGASGHTSIISMWPTWSSWTTYMPLTQVCHHENIYVSRTHMDEETVTRFGSDEATKTTVVQIFQTRAMKISVQGIHGLVCEWDTCLNNNEDSLIWTLIHWTNQMCLIRFAVWSACKVWVTAISQEHPHMFQQMKWSWSYVLCA
jgi:hypothetical protein